MLKGKRTILVGALMIVGAVVNALLGNMEINQAIQTGMEGAAIIFLRLGIKTSG